MDEYMRDIRNNIATIQSNVRYKKEFRSEYNAL